MNPSPLDPPLGSLVRFHRKRARLSQVELAAMAGVSRKVVQDIEVGRDAASWKNVLGILDVLNIRLRPEGPLVGEWLSQTASLTPADPAPEENS
jgi:DNA-binding XRE family transcriptional regulator